MDVAIIGSRDRMLVVDEKAVFDLMESLREKYGTAMTIYSSGCDRGIGAMVKKNCLQTKEPVTNKYKFKFVEINAHVFADIPRQTMQKIYEARNATVIPLSDEFHIFVSLDRKGAIENFLKAAELTGRPVFVYEFGKEPVRLTGLTDGQTGAADSVPA